MEILGYLAATLTTIAFIPQALLVYKTKNTESISLLMFIIFFGGLISWTLYGWSIGSMPILVANVCTMVFAGYILVMKLMEKKQK